MSVPFTILRCLVDGPSYGYELQRRLATHHHCYPLNNVNVYPVLNELEVEGYARSETKLVRERTRRVYTITEKGRRAFEEWLSAPPEFSLPEVRDPIHLRLVLATDSHPDLPWVEDAIREVEAEAALVRETLAKRAVGMAPVARLAIEELVANLDRRRVFLKRVADLQASGR